MSKWKSIKWLGINRNDGRYRIYKRESRYKHVKGRLISSFTRSKLIKIAWKIGASNLIGMNHDYCKFKDYINGWNRSTKSILCQHIWHHLHLNKRVITI